MEKNKEMRGLWKESATFIARRGTDFQDFSVWVNRKFGMPESALRDQSVIGIYRALYVIAMAQGKHPPIWALDFDAFDALSKTEIPFELAREALPKMPFPSLMLTFPDGIYLEGDEYRGRRNKITSLAVQEEIPGIKWRFVGYEEKPRDTPLGDEIAFTFGWIDLRNGPLRKQLPAYSDMGHSAVWQMLLNLFLTLEHGYLAGRHVRPRMPRSMGKKKKFLRKRTNKPYTVINLTAATREAAKVRAKLAADSDARSRKSPGKHTVRGHWHAYWVNDPDGRVVIGIRDVEKGGNFKIAKYLPPFTRGHGGPEERRYKVIAPGWKRETE
jgi:hypothetical protein